jgi:release factor glutamine methyltransferase
VISEVRRTVAERSSEAPSSAGEMLARAREFLTRKNAGEARLSAELLVAHALGLDRLHLFLQLDRPVNEHEIARARDLLVRRAKGEPVAYITGQREFYGRSFDVDRAVLIPRPETELIVDLARARAKPGARMADIGTGSGCLASTLALEIADARVHAVDVSAAALTCARRNAAKLAARVEFVEGDGPRALASVAPFDLIVSNPPYIAPEQRATLAVDVRDFEPALALFTPPGDPEHWLRRLLDEALPMLDSGGAMLVELGLGQSDLARKLCEPRRVAATFARDFAGTERVLVVSR